MGHACTCTHVQVQKHTLYVGGGERKSEVREEKEEERKEGGSERERERERERGG